MSVEQITIFKKKRGSLKRQLTTLEVLLDSITVETDIPCLYLETRLKNRLLPLLDEFEKNEKHLESLTENDESEAKKNDDERESFENRYYSICGRIKTLIKRGAYVPHVPPSVTNSQSSPPSSIDTSRNNGSNSSSDNSDSIRDSDARNNDPEANENNDQVQIISNSNRQSPRVKYPDLKIPTFAGSFDTWLGFYDSFNSMIHNDSDLPTIQKFHYLKGCVTGDAANIISSLATTTENYQVAWDLLKNRYDNKKFIIDSHVKQLFEMPCMSKEFSIRALYDMTQKHIRALRALSVELDKGDAITIHLIKNKLNNYAIEKWEESTCNVEKPTLKDLLQFLERRSQIEETRAAINQTQIQRNLHVKNGSVE